MNVNDVVFIVGALLLIPLCGLITWVVNKINDRMNDRRDEVDELREKLRTAEDERDGWKETAESTHKLLRAEQERADRLAAMNQGLIEDIAALKAYDPDEIEERLKKIREIRADEERQKAEAQLKATLFRLAGVAMSNPYVGNPLSSCGYGFPESAYCSLADQRRISWRWRECLNAKR